ncbi:LysR family transcriptional regulator substrate-binding protein [Nesterenkonia sp. HG001]|uniref:LysR family transcriptional regulator substrate-binding protein n=1 Tax=Nesterenkonia sp. HG001 TaxID=2983207 RepID=UPI002AC62E3D|nr:LysR family transcriptional regulator substrate-binding protein [Nesterenkonia sp. HG001]MDZ5077430.1 LysR family transcriptional regulator substrate-binding protein [Nesterenkonia sp. HG001]
MAEGDRRSRLRIGAIPGATPGKWANRWRERFPGVPLQVEYFDDVGLLERVRSGTVDVGYVRLREDAEEGLVDPELFHRVVLYREEPVVCASRDHWVAAAEQSVEWEEIAQEPLLDTADMRTGVTDAQEVAAAERIALEVVASGSGLLVLPNSVARMLSRKDVVIRQVEGLAGYDVGLCWRRDQDDEVIQEFIGVARGRRSGSGRSGLEEQDTQKKPVGKAAGKKPAAKRQAAGKRTSGSRPGTQRKNSPERGPRRGGSGRRRRG